MSDMDQSTRFRSDTPPGPPEAPGNSRKVQFHKLQLIGMPIIMLIPILALLGVFGTTYRREEVRQNDVVLTVEHPDRAHYEAQNEIWLLVQNVSDVPLSDVSVRFERELLDSFSLISMNPTLEEIDENAYVILFGEVPPGDARGLSFDFRCAEQGLQQGWVAVYDGETPLAQVEMSIMVFP